MCTRISRLPAQLLLLSMVFMALSKTVQSSGVQSRDLYRLRAVGEVTFSRDGKYIAYSVENNDRPGRPYSQVWILDVSSQKSIRLGGAKEVTSGAEWSPDGQWIAYHGGQDDQTGLMVAHADGSGGTLLAPVRGTNNPLPMTGKDLAWSPDSKTIAFISAMPGPETEEANGDPMVITRYLYKPTDSEGLSHFNDNRRLHIFVVDLATKQVRQLTNGTFYEHSIDWSPNSGELLFVSNREPNADQFFNYDLFALRIADSTIRRLTATENAEYRPRWSPDGREIVYQATRRGLTDLETTMEDTHVWLMNPDGSNRRELTAMIDNRQGVPGWAPDGLAIYFTVQQRGNVRLYRVSTSGGQPEVVVNERGTVGSWSVSKVGTLAYSFHTPKDLPQLYLKASGTTKQLTDLNAAVVGNQQVADVETFTFISNDNKYEVEAFLTKPLGMTSSSRHPLIVNIHGGPHGQNGPAFSFKSQIYAARGWATLMVNYRGSTGYGQAFTDAVFGDQNGNEAQDVLYGVSAALRRYLWLDRERMGVEGVSYGGQLTNWIITQTGQFKAGIPIAGISNLISYNYMTYYNQYEQMEFGAFPHQNNLMDVLWERSALKHVAKVRTPTMFMHGENDSDVPIAETEQYYIALKDVGVETIMVRYPREGHGLREVQHIVDSIDRCIAWYVKHFPDRKAVILSPAAR
jgi:dipeptidyl aminopeptidase/acylaminoacyl peptidase